MRQTMFNIRYFVLGGVGLGNRKIQLGLSPGVVGGSPHGFWGFWMFSLSVWGLPHGEAHNPLGKTPKTLGGSPQTYYTEPAGRPDRWIGTKIGLLGGRNLYISTGLAGRPTGGYVYIVQPPLDARRRSLQHPFGGPPCHGGPPGRESSA